MHGLAYHSLALAAPEPVQSDCGRSDSGTDNEIRQRGAQRPTAVRTTPGPKHWGNSAVYTECSLHQLAPYIGKLKSVIARDLLETYSRPGDLVVDPFSGSGTIPLEAILLARRVFASDVSTYAATLTRAKLAPPPSLGSAMNIAQQTLDSASRREPCDLRRVPSWVRRFFHARTLKSAVAFSEACRTTGQDFLSACLLGILHHQRPGFLSFPSSHLVPYLRDRNFPREAFPELYGYRELAPRLFAKIRRALMRYTAPSGTAATFVHAPLERVPFPNSFDSLITSPPYMNALDYDRDNRLRLWFLGSDGGTTESPASCRKHEQFVRLISCLADIVEARLAAQGHCVLVVGDAVRRGNGVVAHPAQIIRQIMRARAPSLVLCNEIIDSIPDVRRARRQYSAVKTERILVFRRFGSRAVVT